MTRSKIYEAIGQKIRELRNTYCGRGISQEDLAKEIGTTTNTISRWETATYKPSIQDIERIARFFGVPIAAFFPTFSQARRSRPCSAQPVILKTMTWKNSRGTPNFAKPEKN